MGLRMETDIITDGCAGDFWASENIKYKKELIANRKEREREIIDTAGDDHYKIKRLKEEVATLYKNINGLNDYIESLHRNEHPCLKMEGVDYYRGSRSDCYFYNGGCDKCKVPEKLKFKKIERGNDPYYIVCMGYNRQRHNLFIFKKIPVYEQSTEGIDVDIVKEIFSAVKVD